LKRILTAFAAAILLSGYATAKDSDLRSLSADHFRDTASVKEDAANDATIITTERGYVERSIGTVWHDEYLRAVIDHNGDRKTFEIDVLSAYTGPFRSYGRAIIEGPAGPLAATPTLVRTETNNCQTGECLYTEYLAIPVDESALRQIAATYAPGNARLFELKLVPKTGRPYRGLLSNAEAAGFLARVDGYRAAPGAAPAPAVLAPPPPQRLPLGISGLAVGASGSSPERAGVLVVSVSPGSVAQLAGVITGDIVYRLDARPIKTPGDLEAAVAGIAAGSAAVIHVFRGTAEESLSAHF
jgi:membrane-associated protease RseP (regulator of RpoE activity)